MFSALAFMNNVVCYTFAPIAHLAEEFYAEAIPLSFLITIFFITYVVFAFPSVRLIDTYGLRPCLIVSAWLMCVGCGMRILSVQANKASAYYMVLFGQTIASLSQCVLVNSPPLLSQVWFGEKERTLATTIAVNCNTMGIAGAYLLGPMLVKNKDDIPFLNTVIFMCTLILAWLVLVFPVAPPSPPSFSSFVKSNSTCCGRGCLCLAVESSVPIVLINLADQFVIASIACRCSTRGLLQHLPVARPEGVRLHCAGVCHERVHSQRLCHLHELHAGAQGL